MAIKYNGGTSFEIQPGWEVEDTPEGLSTITVKFRGKTSGAASWWASMTRGTACTISGFTGFFSTSRPRLVHEGAWTSGYVVYQLPDAGSGSSDSTVEIDITGESQTATLTVSTEANTAYKVYYVAPTVTASYVSGSKPTSFRYESTASAEADPEVDNIEYVGNVTRKILESGTDYKIKVVSKWGSRRNVGGTWHNTEIHQKQIVDPFTG